MILLRQFLVWSIPLWLTAFAVAAFAADAKPGWQGDWERTLGAAEKEGEVAVAIYDQGPVTAAVVDAFRKPFRKSKPTRCAPVAVRSGRKSSPSGARKISNRFIHRRQRHGAQYLARRQGARSDQTVIDPARSRRFVEMVAGQSSLRRPRGAYVLAFVGNGGGVEVTFNTNLVNPKELKSYWDLVNPKWKEEKSSLPIRVWPGKTGRCCISTTARRWDRISCAGSTAKWISRSAGITANRSTGCQSANTRSASRAIPGSGKGMKQGLPIAQINQFKEGVTLTSSGGTPQFLNRAPHPNAAKVFVNWLLSRDAQTLMQKSRRLRFAARRYPQGFSPRGKPPPSRGRISRRRRSEILGSPSRR